MLHYAFMNSSDANKMYFYLFRVMDVKSFYGRTRAVQTFPENNESDVDYLSNDECVEANILGNVLACETDDFESENEIPLSILREMDIVIPGSDEELEEMENANKTKTKIKKTDIKWIEGNLMKSEKEMKFLGDETLPKYIIDLDANSPIDFFQFLFPNTVIKLIVQESNLYSVQIRPEKPVNITESEIKSFIGTLLAMSIMSLPKTRRYWSNSFGWPFIMNSMTVNRSEEIKRFIHFNNNDNFEGNTYLLCIKLLKYNINSHVS